MNKKDNAALFSVRTKIHRLLGKILGLIVQGINDKLEKIIQFIIHNYSYNNFLIIMPLRTNVGKAMIKPILPCPMIKPMLPWPMIR